MMKDYGLQRVHETNMLILKEIDRICRKYKIEYRMDAGTLLGAVRHKGFIPWDDDADIAFTRNNYEAFLKVVRRELPEHMHLVTPQDFQGGKVFYDFTARIIYDKSKIHEDGPEVEYYDGKLNHIWVDMFILDKLPENKLDAQFTLLLHKIIYGFSMGHRSHLDYSKYSLPNKLFVGTLANIGKLIPMKVLFPLQRAVAVKDKKKKSSLCYYSNYQPDYLYVTLKKKWCDETVDLEFEGVKLMAPKNWDEVLKWIYGDYMKLPPEEQRVPSHSSTQIQIFD